jgi:threonine dehydrogenase-like Zn-dependent dehydrogenase
MIGITVSPGVAGSARVTQLDPPVRGENELLVQMLALGVCGTDREIVDGGYGFPPPGRDWLVLGHESLGRVRAAPAGSEYAAGDLLVGIVRRPDPDPCPCCARGEFDMCRNGRYRERGIKELDGYGAELVTVEPEFTVKVDPALGLLGVLTEPTSVVAKAWEQVERVSDSACRPLETVLVTGAGPIGLLAALLGTQRGLRVHVLDTQKDGPKPALTRALGATYHAGSVREACQAAEPDIVLECTGVPEVVVDAVVHTAPAAVVCLLGVSPRGRTLSLDVGAINNELVLENDVVLGSVNANRRHFATAVQALAAAEHGWLEGMITRRVPMDRWADALEKRPTDIKTIIEFSDSREVQ